MANLNDYGGVIWTNHALERLAARRLPQQMALQTFQNPQARNPGKQSHTTEFSRYFGESLVTVIATQNEKSQWVIVSCWVDPPLPGSIDIAKQRQWETQKQQQKEFRRAYNKASFWGKFWLEIRRQLFGK